jgi:hypothetical protein
MLITARSYPFQCVFPRTQKHSRSACILPPPGHTYIRLDSTWASRPVSTFLAHRGCSRLSRPGKLFPRGISHRWMRLLPGRTCLGRIGSAQTYLGRGSCSPEGRVALPNLRNTSLRGIMCLFRWRMRIRRGMMRKKFHRRKGSSWMGIRYRRTVPLLERSARADTRCSSRWLWCLNKSLARIGCNSFATWRNNIRLGSIGT